MRIGQLVINKYNDRKVRIEDVEVDAGVKTYVCVDTSRPDSTYYLYEDEIIKIS